MRCNLKKKIIYIILFIVLIFSVLIFLEKNRDYAIREIVYVKPLTDGSSYAEIYITETSLSKIILLQTFSINSSKQLCLHDIVKLRFKYSPFIPMIFTDNSKTYNFSKGYYINKINRK